MSVFKVTFIFALLVLQCLAQNWSDDLPQFPNQEPSISLATLYRELRNQSSEWVDWHLVRMFTAAADGDEFYNLEVALSDHNRQTAQAVMKMLLQFPTQEETLNLLNRAMIYTRETISTSSNLRHPLEVLTNQLDKWLRQDSNLSSTYGLLMADSQNSVLSSNPKRYFNRVINVEAGYFPFVPNFMAIPGNLKLMLQNGFREKLRYGKYGSRTTFNEYVQANAIYRLGRRQEYADRVEQIREKVTGEILALMLKEKLVPFFFEPDWFVEEMLRRIERSLNEQPDLRRKLMQEKEAIESEIKSERLLGNNSFKNKYAFITKSRKNMTT